MLSRGTQVDHYLLEEPLGAGGMGEVYVAFDTKLERRVALKLLPRATARDAEARARMVREARAASALRHPGIVTVYGVGETDERSYIAMELVEGETFAQLIARRGPLPPAEAVELVARVGDALAAAHRAGILHRDVKSANLMVEPGGAVKVLDFGLSKRLGAASSQPPSSSPATPRPVSDAPLDPEATTLADSAPSGGATPADLTAEGTRMGTPAYSAPELWDGARVDLRCDVFSLGVVLYELVAGRRPFDGDTERAVRQAISDERHPPLPGARFDAVVARALRADPARRFASVPEMVAAARAALRPRTRAWWLAPPLALGGLAAWWALDARTPLALPAVEVPGPAPRARPVALTTIGACAYSPAFIGDADVVFDVTRAASVDLYQVPAAGGPVRQLTSSAGWEWRAAPANEPGQVLFLVTDTAATDGAGNSRIGNLDLASGKETGHIPGVAPTVAAAADGVYYVRPAGRQLRRATGTGDELVLDLPDPLVMRQMTVSPDRQRIAFVPEGGVAGALCVIDVPDKNVHCTPRDGILQARVAFAPDGQSIYYGSADGIHRYQLASGADELVAADAIALGGVTVAPGGRALVYSDCGPGGPLVDVGVRPPAVVVDERTVGEVTVGPGGRLAWVHRTGRGDVLQVRAGAGTRELTDGSLGPLSGVSFDAAGERIAFVALGEAGGVHVVDLGQRTGPRRISDDPSDSHPVWLRDGRLAWAATDDAGVRHLRIADLGKNEPALQAGEGMEPVGTSAATGELLVGTSKGLRWWHPGTGKHRPGPDIRVRGEAANIIAVSPDGVWLALALGRFGERIFRVDLRQARPEPEAVHTLVEGETLGALAIRDDGHVILQAQTWRGELFSLRL